MPSGPFLVPLVLEIRRLGSLYQLVASLLPGLLPVSGHLSSEGTQIENMGVDQALLSRIKEFDGLFISALLHEQQGQLQQGIWNQVVVVFNLLFTAEGKQTSFRFSSLPSWNFIFLEKPDPHTVGPVMASAHLPVSVLGMLSPG